METISTLLAICAWNSPATGEFPTQWRGAFMFPLICAWGNGWVNNPEVGDLTRHRAHCDITVMISLSFKITKSHPHLPGTNELKSFVEMVMSNVCVFSGILIQICQSWQPFFVIYLQSAEVVMKPMKYGSSAESELPSIRKLSCAVGRRPTHVYMPVGK